MKKFKEKEEGREAPEIYSGLEKKKKVETKRRKRNRP